MNANVTHVRKVYQARKERLLRRMPAQPIREVKIPMEAASVERTSSVWLPVLKTSA